LPPEYGTSKPMKTEDVRKWLSLIVAIIVCAAFGLLLSLLWRNRFDPVLTTLVLKNFPAIIGLPAAAGVSFIVITFFRQTETPIEFEALGIKLKGASGEIVLWIVTFFVIVVAIHIVWIS